MRSGASPPRDVVERIADIVSSPALNVLVGIAGVVMPVVVWASHRPAAVDLVLAAETILLLALVFSHLWLRRTHIYLRRPASRSMSDPRYFGVIRTRLESDLIADFGEIADGHLLAYDADVPRLAILLVQVLIDSPTQPKRVLATDLATPLGVHLAGAGMREYHAENRRLIDAGGEIRRIFICWAADLETERYARDLQQLVDNQRSLGVHCGVAVRDRLSAEQAVDFLVISRAAVGVQEDQATRRRTSVHFKNIDRWVRRHESLWVHGSASAASALAAYESVTQPMLASGAWDKDAVRTCVERLYQP
jgi:hypothetical protein